MIATGTLTKQMTRPLNQSDLESLFGDTLSGTPDPPERRLLRSFVRETMEIELPSDLRYLEEVTSSLVEWAAKFGIVRAKDSDLFIALDEALANAIKHGNREDASKIVRVRAEISTRAACFTISDEGAGFNPATIPDPHDPANLFKASGRGIMLMRQIMDYVCYNERGNEVTMLKFAEPPEEECG